jgi:hypothetical protein
MGNNEIFEIEVEPYVPMTPEELRGLYEEIQDYANAEEQPEDIDIDIDIDSLIVLLTIDKN